MTGSGPAGRIVAALVEEGIVAADRADDAQKTVEAALAPPSPKAQRVASNRPRLAEVAAYAGAALVIASIVLLGVQYWGQWQPAVRSTVLGVVALVLLAAGVLVARMSPLPRTRYFVATLVVIGAIAMALAVGTYISATRYGPPDYDRHNVSASLAITIALVILGLGYLLVRTILLHLALAVAAFSLITSLWLGAGTSGAAWLPDVWRAALVMLGAVAWGLLAETGRWREQTLGRAITAPFLITGCQMLLFVPNPGWAHAFTLAAAFVLFGLYWWRGDWPYLAGGVLALTIAITEAMIKWTHGSLGAGGAVLVAGLTLLLASGAAALLRRRRAQAAA